MEDIWKYKECLSYAKPPKLTGQKETSLNESMQILPHYFRKVKTLQATEEKWEFPFNCFMNL